MEVTQSTNKLLVYNTSLECIQILINKKVYVSFSYHKICQQESSNAIGDFDYQNLDQYLPNQFHIWIKYNTIQRH